jgi:MtN3 and saliva related transmembrane protein
MMENSFTDIVGLAAGICTAVSLLPQIIKMIKERKAQDISLFYLIVLLCGLALWTYYGFLKQDVPIIATNIFSMVLNIVVIILGSIYKRKENDTAPVKKKN